MQFTVVNNALNNALKCTEMRAYPGRFMRFCNNIVKCLSIFLNLLIISIFFSLFNIKHLSILKYIINLFNLLN